ncbi:MAG TPA: TlpA disulfide reductase family protein [Thermoanaerobaculia bacterium]|nr:TlpA disulfide reductase family protein [Thermoanaerobaculia bacterium]
MRKLTGTFLFVAMTMACHRETPVAKTAAPPATPPAVTTAATTAVAPAAASAAAAGSADVGAMMPDYQAQWLDGKPMDIASRRGKVVFLNLWATWCQPCRYEIPQLQKMQDHFAAQGFEVIGVSLDEGGVDGVREFVKKQGMTYPIALDPEGKLANLFQTTMIPTSVLIDRSGRIVWKSSGALMGEDKDLNEALRKALAQKS